MSEEIENVEEPEKMPRCDECNYFEAGAINKNDITDRSYFCKRFPPQLAILPGGVGIDGKIMVSVSSLFPTTLPLGWCGEWDDGNDDDDAPETIDPP